MIYENTLACYEALPRDFQRFMVLEKLLKRFNTSRLNTSCCEDLVVLQQFLTDSNARNILLANDFVSNALNTISAFKKNRTKYHFVGILLDILTKLSQLSECSVFTQDQCNNEILQLISTYENNGNIPNFLLIKLLNLLKEILKYQRFATGQVLTNLLNKILYRYEDEQILECTLEIVAYPHEFSSDFKSSCRVAFFLGACSALSVINMKHHQLSDESNGFIFKTDKYFKQLLLLGHTLQNMAMVYRDLETPEVINWAVRVQVQKFVKSVLSYYLNENNLKPFPTEIWSLFEAISYSIQAGLYTYDLNNFLETLEFSAVHARITTGAFSIILCILWPALKFISVTPTEIICYEVTNFCPIGKIHWIVDQLRHIKKCTEFYNYEPKIEHLLFLLEPLVKN